MLYYTLGNGEEVRIEMQEGEDLNKILTIHLFGGTFSIEKELEYEKNYNLNEILSDIEKNYSEYEEEDRNSFYRANGFYD